ncbi:MAG: hypothetical protein U5N85_00365 [Arcicella sp.]|nr:hypothetical protein [Arcicella sp.]
MKLQNQVEELENTLLHERERNAVLSSFRFNIDTVPCKRGMREVKNYSGSFDSLCIMYNNLVDKHNNLKIPSLALEKDFNIHFAKSDSIILKLRTEYKSIKKSPK